MMRIIRVLNITKKNHCIFQNLLRRNKTTIQQFKKLSTSTDALKEKLNENLNEAKKVDPQKKFEEYDCSPSKEKIFNPVKNNFQLRTDFTSNIVYQNKAGLIKIIANMTSSSAVLLLKNLSSNRTRFLDVLNALSAKLQSDPPSTLIECSAVLYCAAVLNFRDVNLIKTIGQKIIERKSDFTSHKLPTNIMRSLGVLKYNEQELLEVLMDNILCYKAEIPEDLVTSLTTLALVNAKTPYAKSLVEILSNYQEIDYSHPKEYLNFVWSCVILNELNPTHISAVLSPNFVNKIIGSEKQYTILLKLQNIQGAVSSLVKSYSGPKLKEDHLSAPNVTKSKLQLLDAVKNSLYYICPKEGFLKFNVNLDSGFLLDVKCNVSSQGEVVRLKQNEGSVKVGMLLLDYYDFCLDAQTMTGISAFKSRIIEAKGYKCLKIPYTEFSVSAKLSEKIDYLRKKFRSVV